MPIEWVLRSRPSLGYNFSHFYSIYAGAVYICGASAAYTIAYHSFLRHMQERERVALTKLLHPHSNITDAQMVAQVFAPYVPPPTLRPGLHNMGDSVKKVGNTWKGAYSMLRATRSFILPSSVGDQHIDACKEGSHTANHTQLKLPQSGILGSNDVDGLAGEKRLVMTHNKLSSGWLDVGTNTHSAANGRHKWAVLRAVSALAIAGDSARALNGSSADAQRSQQALAMVPRVES
eukprot:scaffold52638_cov30-Tisochrysis_lutea.AAC.3